MVQGLLGLSATEDALLAVEDEVTALRLEVAKLMHSDVVRDAAALQWMATHTLGRQQHPQSGGATAPHRGREDAAHAHGALTG